MNRFIVLAMIVLTIALTGCQEEKKVWGNGNPPLEYQEMFGNSNTARLDFVQTEQLNQVRAMIYGTTETDKAGNVTRKKPGLIERVMDIEKKLRLNQPAPE